MYYAISGTDIKIGPGELSTKTTAGARIYTGRPALEQVYPTVPDSASEEHQNFTEYSIAADQGEGVVALEEGWRFVGFTQVENNVIRDAENLSPMARLTYTILRSYGWQDELCWPGMKRLCKDIGRSEPKVRQYIRELVDAGLIAKKRRGQGNTNTYRFRQPAGYVPERNTGFAQEHNTGFDKEYAEEEHSKTPSGGSTPAKESSTPIPKTVEEHPVADNVAAVIEMDPNKGIAERLTSKLARDFATHEVYLDSSQRGRYGRELKDLVRQGATEERLAIVVDRIVERAVEPGRKPYMLSPGEALVDTAVSGESAAGGAAGPATPEPALSTLREHHKFGRFAAAAERHDFTSGREPEWKIWKDCGVSEQECRENARLMGNVARNAMSRAEQHAGESKPSNEGSFKEGYEWFFGE